MNAQSHCTHDALVSLITLYPDSLAVLSVCEWQVYELPRQEWKILFCEHSSTKRSLSTTKSHSCPPLVDDFEVSPLQEAAHFGLSSQDSLHQLSGDLLLLLIRQRHVPLLKPELALSTEQKHELHLQWRDERKQRKHHEMRGRSGWFDS